MNNMNENTEINVLSLFDGMSCGQIALDKLNINVGNYYASEIDKNAIKVTQSNFPNTNQIGSIVDVNVSDLPKIDLLIGGSSCQNFSLAGNKKGMVTVNNIEVTTLQQYLTLKNDGFEFSGESYLFWEYIRILKESKPKYFLLENVMMGKNWRDIITDAVGVEPIMINSNLLSIQNRKRLYWTNITNITQPTNNHKLLRDYYSKTYDDKLVLRGKGLNKLNRPRNRAIDILSDKSPTLMKAQENKPTDSIVFKHGSIYRYPTRGEMELMQTVPNGYTNAVNCRIASGLLGNGWTVDVIVHIFKNMEI